MSVETREKAKISKAETEAKKAKTKTRTETATEKDEDSPQLQHLNKETEGILVPALDQDIKNIVRGEKTPPVQIGRAHV